MMRFYYLFFTLFIFIGLQSSIAQQNCNSLEILTVQDGSVCGTGSVTLKATASGTGDDIAWYDSATGGNLVGIGSTLETPKINSTTSYWATEVLFDGTGSSTYPELLYYKFDEGNTVVNHAAPGVGNATSQLGSAFSVGGTGHIGTALQGTGATTGAIDTGWNMNHTGSFTIGFWTSNVPPSSTLYYIFGDPGATNFRCFTNGVASANNWMLRGGGLPDLTITGSATMAPNYVHVVYDASAGTYTGYVDGVQNVTVTAPTNHTISGGTGFYVGGNSSQAGINGLMDEFRFYDRALSVAEINATIIGALVEVDCESPREEVVATVNNVADEDVLSLPYSHTANTANYDNNYAGTPGANCGVNAAYLNGNDVVYKYEADDDYLLVVSLEDLDEEYTAVFVYESCDDIGDTCLAIGSYVEDSMDDHSFDFEAENGKTYYFVVASADPTETFNYTLKIDGYDCASIPAPKTADASPFFIQGASLASIEKYIEFLDLSQGHSWYSDAALTNVIADPANELLVDGTSYFVTQSVIGCESAYLEMTPQEFDCSALNVIVNTTEVKFCVPGGYATLNAETSSEGDEIFWYDSQTATEPIHKGSTFEAGFIEQTTSYWVSEVTLEGEALEGQGKLEPTLTTTTALNNYGLQFNVTQAFTLVSVDIYPTTSGVMDIELRDAAGTVLDVVSGINVPAGNGQDPFTVPMNIEIPEGQGLRLIKVGATTAPSLIRESSGNAYPYPIGDFGEITGGALNQGTNLTAYYWFYNWTIEDFVKSCESTRVEIPIIVSSDIPDAPEVDSNYVFCGLDTYTLADIEVEGGGIVWYDAVGNEMDLTTEVFNGDVYYVLDTSGGCLSHIAEVHISIRDLSATPTGAENQTYTQGSGATLADLDVNGVQLKWYADEDLQNSLDIETVLEDNTTYYVTQTRTGFCESLALAIHVTETLSVADVNFTGFKFYPNPVKDVLNLANDKQINHIVLYDLKGRIVYKQENINNENYSINLEGISSGNYLLKISVDDQEKTIQIIKQ